jgi:hypothetical protein
MKTMTAITMLMAVVNASASSGQNAESTVHVYVTFEASVAGPLIVGARSCASKLLAPAGVKLVWHDTPIGDPADANSLAMTFLPTTPASYRTGRNAKALAVALPYASTGQQILVFNDRVSDFVAPYGRRSWVVLGHILAHEIGHVLENVARHSDTGLMQANWTRDDISMMIWAGLPFAPEDKALIRARMEFVNRPAAAVLGIMAEGSPR